MSDGQQETTLERRVALPEPDVSNITVLTESLPNEPVLPWHHFDSPWLDRDTEVPPEEGEAEATPEASTDSDPTEQLTLELEMPVSFLDNVSEDNLLEDSVSNDVTTESAA